MVFTLTSPAFGNGQRIPDLHTCRGDDASPPLAWVDPPEGTKSLAIWAEGLDAPIGKITHWVTYSGMEADGRGAAQGEEQPGGMVQGRNGMLRTRYRGPCPP